MAGPGPLLKLADFDLASEAMPKALQVQSLMTGFIRDAEGGTAGFEAASNDMNVSLEPGAMRVLPFGSTVEFSTPGQGLSQAVDFVKGQQREIASGVGLTYEMLSGDLSGTNDSSARVGTLEFRRRCDMLQRTLIEAKLLRPLWRQWIDAKALAGEIGASESELADCRAVKFVAPGWQWVDPLKEVNGEIRAIEAGLKSRAEVVAGRGRDVAELDDEIAADTFARAAKPRHAIFPVLGLQRDPARALCPAIGQMAQVGSIIGVAQAAAAAAADVVLVRHGVFTLAKAIGQAWALGATLYWDNAARNVTTTVASNKMIGAAFAAAAAGDTTASVLLNGAIRV